jgi:glycine cleavage system transcriptional repressor
MLEQFVLIASGGDRLGVVEQFTSLILEHEGNIEASRMARLGGDFAMLMLVTAPAERVAALREKLEGLDTYSVHTRPAELRGGTASARVKPYGITVAGADHLGIIYQIARYLTERGVNIETMNTEVEAAPMSGAPLFTMSAVVIAPAGLDADELRQALARLGDQLGVDTAVLANR